MGFADSFLTLYEIIVRLRSPDGCPWDREQTPATIRSKLIEESYEIIDAVDTGDPDGVREELGDLLMLVLMLARIFEEDGSFSVSSVADEVCEKLVRRHPHVFSDASVESSDEVVRQWERIKVEDEGRRAKESRLDNVSRSLPPLERAYRLQDAAAEVGFDWPEIVGVIDKVREELSEVEEVIKSAARKPPGHGKPADARVQKALEQEVGDILFSAANVSRFLGIDPSVALNHSNRKFTHRFQRIETEMIRLGLPMDAEHLDDMERIWNQSK